MAIFQYHGSDNSGKDLRGIIEADTIKVARQKLKKNGVFLLSIDEKTTKKSKKNIGPSFLTSKKVPVNELSITVRQLASLIKANIPLVEALNAVIDQSEHEYLKIVLSDIRQQVNEGSALYKAIARHPNVFTPIFINMIESGEASGTLPLVLSRLADFSEAEVRLRAKVVSALTYPILMVCVGGLLMMGIFTFVIPKISKVLTSTGKSLPWYTEMLMNISIFLKDYWWTVFLVIFIAVYFFRSYVKSKKGSAVRDRVVLRVPIFGDLIRMVAVSRFASTMATLMAGGVPILTALKIVRAVVNNQVLTSAIASAQENISEGQSIAGPLRKSGEFPKLLTHMIAIGERTGELPQMLDMVAKNYEEQVNVKVDRLTSLLEPLMIVVMGLCVAFIVLAVIVPLMDLQQLSR